MKKTLISLLTLTTLSMSLNSNAVLLLDNNYSQDRVEKNQCIKERKNTEFNINKYGKNGIQTNFSSERNLVKSLGDLYFCKNDEDGIVYGLFFNNRKKDGSIRTIMNALTLKMIDEINMTNFGLYSTIDEIKNHPQFQVLVEKRGKENIFFQGFNLNDNTFDGLYNINKKKLVTRDEELEKYNLPK